MSRTKDMLMDCEGRLPGEPLYLWATTEAARRGLAPREVGVGKVRVFGHLSNVGRVVRLVRQESETHE